MRQQKCSCVALKGAVPVEIRDMELIPQLFTQYSVMIADSLELCGLDVGESPSPAVEVPKLTIQGWSSSKLCEVL